MERHAALPGGQDLSRMLQVIREIVKQYVTQPAAQHQGDDQHQVQVLKIFFKFPETEFFDYQAKYEGKSQEITPARIPEQTARTVRAMAGRIYELLNLSGYSRSEFILVEGIPHLLEVNTTPGLTEASILPQQAAADGIGLTELFGSAIEEALAKK